MSRGTYSSHFHKTQNKIVRFKILLNRRKRGKHVEMFRDCVYRSALCNDCRNHVVTLAGRRGRGLSSSNALHQSISANRVQQHSGLADDLVCSHREVANEVTACRFRKQSNPALTASKSSDDPPRGEARADRSKARAIEARSSI